MIYQPTRLIGAALAGVGILFALGIATAGAASITLTGPEDGAMIPTTGRSTSAVLSWQAETSGCQSSLGSAIPRIVGPIPVVGQTVTGAPPSGANVVTFVNSKPKRTFRWYVSMNCAGVGEVVSARRTFTVQGANPAPRLAGKHRVVWGGTPQIWTFRPLCRRGACNTRVKIPRVPQFVLRYNAAKRIYTARIAGRKSAKAAVCTDKTSGRQFRNAYRGWFRLALKAKTTKVDGVNTLVESFAGRMTGKYRPTPRGKKLRCPAFAANDPVRGAKK